MPTALSTLALLVLGGAGLTLAGCGSRGPADDLGPLLRELGAPGRPTASYTEVLYQALDSTTRQAVDARAKVLSEGLGRTVAPPDAIQFRGFDPGVRVSAVDVVDETGDRAHLKVSLARVGEPEGRIMPEPLVFEAVREDGVWKLVLPDVAREIARP